MRPDSLLRLWHCINHLLAYLLTYPELEPLGKWGDWQVTRARVLYMLYYYYYYYYYYYMRIIIVALSWKTARTLNNRCKPCYLLRLHSVVLHNRLLQYSEIVSDVLQQTLIVAGDVMLIGIVDSELISRVGEFSLSLLQRGIFLFLINYAHSK